MSLYGPKIKLPKVELPSAGGGASWNFEKEKKVILVGAAAIAIILIAVFLLPAVLDSASGAINSSMNPAVQISWKNNPLDLRNTPIEPAEITMIFTNISKDKLDINFAISYPSSELNEYCPEYGFTNVLPGDKRKITCFVRRNGEIFSGTYSLEIVSNLGNAKTQLEVIGK